MKSKPATAHIVWDLPTRLFHWSLVVLIALQYVSGEFDLFPMQWHYLLGYATLALLLFRLLWGFFGSRTSRFADFVRGPRAVAAYLSGAARAEMTRSRGHNPLGGWSVLAMLASVALQGVSGLFASDDVDESGPFADRVSETLVDAMTRIHHYNRLALLGLIALHLAAVGFYLIVKRRNLIAPMLHGRAAADAEAAPPSLASSARAVVLVALSFALVWGALAASGAL